MSFEYFISKKVLNKEVKNNKVSRPIVRISVISISLAVVVNLLTIAVVKGFQREVRTKISGFTAPIFITSQQSESVFEASPIVKTDEIDELISGTKGVKSFSKVAYKPVLLQSDKFIQKIKLSSGKDSTSSRQEIQGGIFKGVENTYDWTFLKKHLTDGRLPKFNDQTLSNEVIVSQTLARNLNLKVGNKLTSFFVNKSPLKRKFLVVGVYNTGLEEFDSKLILGDLKQVQRLNDWGIKSSILVDDTLSEGALIIRADVRGGNGNYRFDWGQGFENYEGFTYFPYKDTVIRLVTSDYWMDIREDVTKTTIPDTTYLKIDCSYDHYADNFIASDYGEVQKTFLNSTGTKYKIKTELGDVFFETIAGKGSGENYISGYEVLINEWNLLDEVKIDLKKAFLSRGEQWIDIKVTSIIDNQNEVFLWLSFLDVNVVIIIVLMLLIGVINICSALLVLILLKGSFVGILKAMGATDWSIRKIFLYQGANIVLKGLFWGNLFGISIALVQYYFEILKLDPSVYYLDKVPISLDLSELVWVNLGTVVVCVVSLILPSFIINKITPSKTIKFN
ncbi:MAG: FtsX-like permease family protein [Crocinitomicaceae bacterium]